jgi:hypothetical protein
MKTIITIMGLVSALTLSAQTKQAYEKTALEEITADRFLAGGNATDYERLPRKALTPAPKGYEPYYMSHYGPHGSRWLLGDRDYSSPVNTLRDAKKAGKLTPVGEQALAKLEEIQKSSKGRLGDLSPVGEAQHHAIGKRMVKNFPEIFKAPNVRIDARSTTVIRSILSMIAECEELAQANPTANIHNEANEANMAYMNPPKEGLQRMNEGKARPIQNEWSAKMRDPRRLMKVLFNDQDWVYMNVMPTQLMGSIYDIATNQQSHDNDRTLLDLFTTEELYRLWNGNNLYWYLNYANAPQTGNVMPWMHANLLKNIIETADTVTQKQATLRFGHDTVVLPIISLMELGGMGCSIDNLEELDTYFRSYMAVPTACNLQLVFYRPKKGKGDILVKAMLNENEVTMPVETSMYPYYKWTDVREYYLEKLKKQPKNPYPNMPSQGPQINPAVLQMLFSNQ